MNHSEGTERKNGVEKIYHSPIKPMFDKFANHKDVTLLYGEPITHEKQTIVPVAKMNYAFGGGGGGGTSVEKDEQKALGHGEGGAGHISVKPLGVYEMTATRVRFKPVIDVKFILTLCSVLTLGMTLLLRKK